MQIETQRLHLRPLTPDDLPALHRILSDPITMSFWPAPFSEDASRAWIERQMQNYQQHGFGRLALIERVSGELIGDCGIMPALIDGQPENDLGYIIFHTFWRQGYASEAAAAWLQHGFDLLQLDRICANMPVDHLGSRRVAEKIGMRLEREFHNQRNRNILTCLYAAERS